MGCTNQKQKKQKIYDQQFIGDSIPNDAHQFKDLNLPALQFQLRISNLKLKNVFRPSIVIRLKIPDILDLNLQKKSLDKGSDKWNIDHRISFKINQYQLRMKFLTINLVDQHSNKLGQVSLNLYKVATGPYHHDFPIKYLTQIGRISMDLRITQKIQFMMSTKNVTVNLLKQHSQQQYYCQCQVNSSKQNIESQSSYNKEVRKKPNTRQQNVEMKSSIIDEKRSTLKRSLTKREDQYLKIIWSQQQAIALKSNLPSIKLTILVSDLTSGSFQFLIWTTQKDQQQQLFAQCYISFNKIFEKQFEKIRIKDRQHQSRQLNITQKIWNHGKLIGDMNMKFQVIIPKYYKQMIVFVRTEQGIQKASPIFSLKQDRKNECLQIVSLYKIKQQLDMHTNNLTKLIHEAKNDNDIQNQKMVIKQILSKIEPLFLFSVKQSSILYSYNNPQQLFRGQIIIMQIGFKLLQFLEQQQTTFDDICWVSMIAMMNRGEMSLRYIGFKAQTQDQQTRKKKIQLSIKYQTFLYRILRISLNCLNKKALQENQRTFVQLFCAYAYFRIPQFRTLILKTLVKKNDPEIQEWRGTSYSLSNPEFNITQQSNTIKMLFDWDTNFYHYIKQDQRCKQNYLYLAQILSANDWKHRMQKRGVAFFYFIIYWINYVQIVAIKSQNVQWHYLPGYLQLLNAFLCQMKIRSILQYPDSLKSASVKLLGNEKLLNIFITILFKKTQIYDSICVIKTMDIINSYINYIIKIKKFIPTTFNYTYFLTGIKQILASDHSFAIAKCLLLIYNGFNLFSLQFRRDISMFLLGKVFFKLFLNWSRNVRLIFQHLLMFRIYLQSNILQKFIDKSSQIRIQYDTNQQIKKRYISLRTILQNAKIVKQSKQVSNLTYNFEKEYYKKMKKKMYDKRKDARNRQRNEDGEILQQTGIKYQKRKHEFSIKQLTKKIPQRYLSEATNIKISYPQIIRENNQGSGSHLINENSPLTKFRPEIQNQEKFKSQQKKRKRKMSGNVNDYDIQQINLDLLEYLNDALLQFNKCEDIYQVNYQNATEKDPVPVVEIRIPIDQGEIRPEDIDEW